MRKSMLHEVNKKIFKDLIKLYITVKGLPKWYSSKEFLCQCRRNKRCGSIPGSGKIPWRRESQPTPVSFPGKFQRQRSLAGYSPWGHKESDMTEQLSTHNKWQNWKLVVFNCLGPHGLCSPWNSPGQNTGVGSLSLLQGIFATQGSNWGLRHSRQILYQWSHKGSPSTGVGSLSLQRIFLTHLHCRWILYQLGY